VVCIIVHFLLVGYGLARSRTVSVSYIGCGEPPEFVRDPSTDSFICTAYVEESQSETAGPDRLNFMFQMIPHASLVLDIYGAYGKNNVNACSNTTLENCNCAGEIIMSVKTMGHRVFSLLAGDQQLPR
jgi:hypothetical protein